MVGVGFDASPLGYPHPGNLATEASQLNPNLVEAVLHALNLVLKVRPAGFCERFDQFKKKAIRWIAVGTSLPGVVLAVVAVLKFFGRILWV
jgi:hypothetical protein